MTLLQKAVSPRLSRAYLREGYDRVGGHVVRVADVRFATSPTELAAVHGLHAPGSGWTPDAPWVDLLRFEADWYLTYLAEPGFAVPLWWLQHTRIPPGAQLLRRYADGGTELLARYGHAGTGWRPADPDLPAPPMSRLSQCVGPVAVWRGQHYDADVIAGRMVVATSTPAALESGLWQGADGRWFRQVPFDEVADVMVLEVTATWHGLPVRVVDQVLSRGHQMARIVPAGDDVASARSQGMTTLDADAVEAWVVLDELDGLTSARVADLDSGWRPPAGDDALPVPELDAPGVAAAPVGHDDDADPRG